ncbi:MAG: DUF58 domain-containing protein [Pirellulales bacterium]|nr:DUF58 domain-containing protein [Pirellulales bacterium]
MTKETGYRFLDPAALARIKSLSLAARGVVEGFIAGMHASPNRGFSIEFAEHRNYVRGDNLRHLDWRMLARTDRLYVKQYEEETNLRAQIILDTSSSMLYRSGKALSKLEYSAYLVAVLALLMTRQQDAVGLTTCDEQLRLDMPARTSPRHFGEMMRQLEATCDQLQGAGAGKTGRGTDIANTLHRLAERFKRRCLVLLISDLYDDLEAMIHALHHFRHRHHEVILFHVFDEAEIEFPFHETAQFEDMETGARLQVDPSFVRDDYREQMQAFIDTYRKACADCQIDYIMTHTSVPYDLMLSRYLAKRSTL